MSKPRYKLERSKYPGTENVCDDCAFDWEKEECPWGDCSLVCASFEVKVPLIFIEVKEGE